MTETLAAELTRLSREHTAFNSNPSERAEAWNLLADFAFENRNAIIAALRHNGPATPKPAKRVPIAISIGTYATAVVCDDGAMFHGNDGKTWTRMPDVPQPDRSNSPQAKAGRARQAKMTPEQRAALVAKARAVRDENTRLRKLRA